MKKRKPPIPQLWVEEVQLLAKVVADLPDQSTIVEIGTAQGGGFHLIAKSRLNPRKIALHSYDPYPGKALSALVKMHKNSFSHALPSSQGAKAWRSGRRGKVDLLIIDGSHTLESVHLDYTAWKRHLSRPAEIIFHDYDPDDRDGASHPGVKVFCDSLLSCGFPNVVIKSRRGRYLHLFLPAPPVVTLDDLKGGFNRWIANAIQIAVAFRSGKLGAADALLSHCLCHSRLNARTVSPARGIARRSDLAFSMHAASAVGSIHELLLERAEDRAAVLKWIEYLEMFLHARRWAGSRLLDVKQSPILRACHGCSEISSLSRLCADMSLLVGVVEALFGYKKK